MQRTLFIKLGTIGVLCAVLIIPLAMISDKIGERSGFRDQVKMEMADGWSHNQTVIGPVLVVPYQVKSYFSEWDKNLEQYVEREKLIQRQKFLFPDNLDIAATIDNEERYRGIYSIPVYKSRVRLEGEFTIPENFGVDGLQHLDAWGTPYLSLGVGDLKGITSDLNVVFNNRTLEAKPGSKLVNLAAGVHVVMGQGNLSVGSRVPFSINLTLKGMDRFEIIPAGKLTNVSIESSWPHPSFIGRYSDSREISSAGFTAEWSVSDFSTGIEQIFGECVRNQGYCPPLNEAALGVAFIKPVDTYLKTERATKYGLLFIFLVFGVFFLYEIIRSLAVHPIQYLLVGLALAMFFQLLLSLSEHMSFLTAYAASALASILLIVFYVSYVLRSLIRSSVLGCALVAIYGLLYMILKSEDYSLLMGSILLMGALAIFMVVTRKVDWYGLSDTKATSRNWSGAEEGTSG